MKILVKIATRERPHMLLPLLAELKKRFSNENTYQVVLSCDDDDEVMKAVTINDDKVSIFFSPYVDKMNACNRDIDKVPDDWDVLMAIDDDMMPVIDNWDKYISDGYEKHFPDTDGVLWFCDGHREDLNTYALMGNKYYKRFNYIYHPAYKAFFCDNEFHAVAMKLGKCAKYMWPTVVIEHQHYSFYNDCRGNNLNGADDLQCRNRKHWEHDANIFSQRSKINYGL